MEINDAEKEATRMFLALPETPLARNQQIISKFTRLIFLEQKFQEMKSELRKK